MFRYLALSTVMSLSACTPRPVPPPSTQAGNVIAVVGDVEITDSEFLDRLKKIESEFPRKFEAHPQKVSILKEMMNVELLYQEAIARGLDKSFEFKTRLADLYVRQLADKARAEISDRDIQNAYDFNPTLYDQISAKHILLRWNPGASSADKAKIREQMEVIRKEAEKDPKKFGTLAQQKSQDSSAASEGELGFFSRSMMVKPFSDAAFKLKKVGDISPIVESQYGLHIIQLSGDRRGIEFVKDQIRDNLLRSRQQQFLSTELERLKEAKKFVIYDEPLLKLSPLPNIVHEDPEKSVDFKEKNE